VLSSLASFAPAKIRYWVLADAPASTLIGVPVKSVW